MKRDSKCFFSPRKVYVFATHGIFSGVAKSVLKESPNLEKVFVKL